MMHLNGGRLVAIARKEVREYRRSRFIIGTMVVLPLIFMLDPMITIFAVGPTARAALVARAVGSTFLLLLVVPAVVPATIAAYSVVGEREQGTLEPLLTTPVRREEILLGKALASIVPSVGIAYALFAVVVVCAHLFASNPTVASTLTEGPHILAEALFAPLLAAWSIWVGTAISARSSDVRVAQQLGSLASLPPLGVTALVSFQILAPSVALAVEFGLGLLALDVALWLVVSAMFERERLITGARAQRADGTGGGPHGEVRRIRRTGGDDGGRSDT
ncbi:MAG TPA: ABC transporter permease subunit [Candidatus Micrarchaeia archaeon]|nr:ABC transporter permease subunit [Candidatus Micrarchaeia archaeon]